MNVMLDHSQQGGPSFQKRRQNSTTRSQGSGSDLLMLVMSCHKNAVRRQAIRATWGKDLASHGIRQLFVVGTPGQTATLRDDVLTVDSRDNYEYLVLKVLRAMEWVYRSSDKRLRYIFKVDDDCYVNAQRLLGKPFRASPYSGRVLRVREVPPDATWHVGKCEDPRYEAPYTQPYRCDMATGIGYFVATGSLAPLVREIPAVEDQLDRGLYDFEDKRVAETLWTAGISVTQLAGYGAVFLDKDQRFGEPWRVDPTETHRFVELDIITECDVGDLHRIHRVVTRDASSQNLV